MHTNGERPRWMPQDCQPGQCQDWPLLWAKKIRFQETMTLELNMKFVDARWSYSGCMNF